ncbi:MAG: phosphoenolpyruvate carboxylase, partial [Oceanobacter sp.]
MSELDSALRDKVRLLGTLLGQTIQRDLGDDMLGLIETIRQQSKNARAGDDSEKEKLLKQLTGLSDDELLPVVRGFNQFLNLANIADQQHSISWCRSETVTAEADQMFVSLLDRLQAQELAEQNLAELIENLNIELVLTAHPTEVSRRTLIQKYDEISRLLQQRDDMPKEHPARAGIKESLALLIEEIWHTDEIRSTRPTAVDEARWGFAVVENSLWEAIPGYIRTLDAELKKRDLNPLGLTAAPVKFSSWMGGDRDGNPNVTSAVTREVLYLARWMAADLFLRDIDTLASHLSMSACSDELKSAYPDAGKEPYRHVLGRLRNQLKQTCQWATAQLQGHESEFQPLVNDEDLIEPLALCHRSLVNQGLDVIANGALLDTLRRAGCFGLSLVRLDVRQESTRHAQVMDEVCEYYGWPAFSTRTEEEKQAFLLQELQSRRPLIPKYWSPSDNVREVLDTVDVLATEVGQGVSCYIISMASEPSDILSVALLLQDAGVREHFPVVP